VLFRFQLRQIAPEYYNTLAYHTSWTWVIWKFITDPEVGPWSRMKRKVSSPPGTLRGNPKHGLLEPVRLLACRSSGWGGVPV
jgi:hypothetical protein